MKLEGNLRSVQLVAEELTWTLWRTALNRLDAFGKVKDAIEARDREVRAATLREAAGMYEGRIQDVASENFGPFPRQTDEEAMTAIERGIFEQRLTIERLTHPPAAPAAEPGKPATCETCKGARTVLHVYDRGPGDPPGNQMIPCPACGPQARP